MTSIDYAGWAEHEILHGDPQLTEIENRISTRCFDIRLNHLMWPGGGTLRLAPSTCWLDVMLSPRSVTRSHLSSPDVAELTSGTTMLVPAAMPVIVDWRASEIRSITCLFDPAAILSVAGRSRDWSWTLDRPIDERFRRQVQGVGALLVDEMLHPDLASEIKIESLLTYLACQMHGLRGDRTADAVRRSVLDERQLRIIRNTALQTAGPAPTVGMLADTLRLPAPLLGQMFRSTTGSTLRAYLAVQRIERAKRLLADPRLLVKQVAAASGFQSTAAFVAAFRRSVGTTPRDYRATSLGGSASRPD